MTYQTTRFIMYVLNIVLWPLTRVFIFLWIFPEEFVALAFKTASRVFACVSYFFYSSRCIYIDCSIEAHREREKKKKYAFFFCGQPGIIRYPLALLLLVLLQADKIDTFTYMYL